MFLLHDPIDETIRAELSEYDDLIASLLARRGVTTREAAQAFLNPSYEEHVQDPMQIMDMSKAAERIARAINDREKITVWSDYDCDGIPGGVILHDFLQKAGAHFDNYIPHRHEEGFGVSVAGVTKLAKSGTKVLITVDCGITDVEAIATAGELGMDVIVTDHHLPAAGLPSAYAIIDPKAREEETSSFKEYCGGGLAWKLACGVLAHGFAGRDAIPEGWEKWLLDMAGFATIADMVPLVGENRVIAKYGILVMRKSPRLGLQALCRVARVNQRFITEEDVGFMLAPRINAASRMGTPRDAFELFTTASESRADELSKELEKANRSRKATAAAITRAVHERLSERAGTIPDVIALGDPDWRPGLLGLVANTIAEEYERPVFLWGREGGTNLKGSCRAGRPGVSVVEIMEGAKETFAGFGGHKASGGFTVLDDAVFFLEERLCQSYAALPPAGDVEEARADAQISAPEATNDLLVKLSQLAPFGMSNEKPIFLLKEVRLTAVSWFGKAQEHLKVSITSDGFDDLQGITFFAKRELGSMGKNLKAGKAVSLLAYIERDQFTRGRPIRLRVVGVK